MCEGGVVKAFPYVQFIEGPHAQKLNGWINMKKSTCHSVLLDSDANSESTLSDWNFSLEAD